MNKLVFSFLLSFTHFCFSQEYVDLGTLIARGCKRGEIEQSIDKVLQGTSTIKNEANKLSRSYIDSFKSRIPLDDTGHTWLKKAEEIHMLTKTSFVAYNDNSTQICPRELFTSDKEQNNAIRYGLISASLWGELSKCEIRLICNKLQIPCFLDQLTD